MLSDDIEFWVKLSVDETLKIDPILWKMVKSNRTYRTERALVLPFQVFPEDRMHIFGGEDDLVFSFTLPPGHYQLLFQDRFFTRKEIEASPNNDCEDIEYDLSKCDYIDDFCQITFIPIEDKIEPKFIIYEGSMEAKKFPPIVIHERKISEQS